MTFCSLNASEMNVFQNCMIFFCEFFINQEVYVVHKINCYDCYFQSVNQFQQIGIEKQIQYE